MKITKVVCNGKTLQLSHPYYIPEKVINSGTKETVKYLASILDDKDQHIVEKAKELL